MKSIVKRKPRSKDFPGRLLIKQQEIAEYLMLNRSKVNMLLRNERGSGTAASLKLSTITNKFLVITEGINKKEPVISHELDTDLKVRTEQFDTLNEKKKAMINSQIYFLRLELDEMKLLHIDLLYWLQTIEELIIENPASIDNRNVFFASQISSTFKKLKNCDAIAQYELELKITLLEAEEKFYERKLLEAGIT